MGCEKPALPDCGRLTSRRAFPTTGYRARRRTRPIFWGGAEAMPHLSREKILSGRLREKFAGHTSWDAIAPIWDRFSARGDKSRLHWMT